jgi:putative flippase GtrA
MRGLIDKIKDLFKKYEEIITYLIVGVLTTIVSWVAAWVATLFLDSTVAIQNNIINTISWIAGVLFAYPLSRVWVFKSKNPHIVREFFGFAGSRISTWVLDVFIMWIFVNVIPFTNGLKNLATRLGREYTQDQLDTMNYWIAKIFISSVLVMVGNYVFSKVLIFRKKNTEEEKRVED